MNPQNGEKLLVLVSTLLAITLPLLLVFFMQHFVSSKIDGSRDASIDGARGFLALAVLVHHFEVHRETIITGLWHEPSNTSFRNFGPLAVTFFFMITAYLFYRKLVLKRGNENWIRFYIGRIARLVPMYLVAVSLVLLTVFYMTGFQSNVPLLVNAKAMADWLVFTMRDTPAINGYEQTSMIIARVVWTLRYEWLFYLALPVIALAVRRIVSSVARATVLVSLALAVTYLPHWQIRGFSSHMLAPFLLGMAVFDLSTSAAWQSFCKTLYSNVACGGLLVAAVLIPTQIYGPLQIGLVTVLFAMIASGANLFGLLHLRASRMLGEATYGIYLLHGILLFWFFQYIGNEFNDWTWLCLPLISVAVTSISLAGFFLIEKPFINAARKRSHVAVITGGAP